MAVRGNHLPVVSEMPMRATRRIRPAIAFLTIATLAACSPQAAQEAAPEPQPEIAPAATGLDPGVLSDATRPADEVAQDAARHVVELYEFFGLQDGMTVADVWPGAGYNTHLLSRFNTGGKVYAVMGFYADGQFATLEGLTQRVADAGLDNVEIVANLVDVPAASLDLAIAVRNYHDAEQYGDGRQATVQQLFDAVKPGGVVGIVEVATDRPGWDEETHRLNEQVVIDEFTAGGFVLEASTDMLANPDDDHSTSGFDVGRHTMDRYVLKFRKPAA